MNLTEFTYPKQVFLPTLLILLLAALVLGGCKAQPRATPTQNAAPQVKLVKATASNDHLFLTFQIKGLPQTYASDIRYVVCKPYFNTREHVPVEFFALDATDLHKEEGRVSFNITYRYHFKAPPPKTLHLDNIELTIGPCAPALDESNITPQLIPILADYRTNAVVEIKTP